VRRRGAPVPSRGCRARNERNQVRSAVRVLTTESWHATGLLPHFFLAIPTMCVCLLLLPNEVYSRFSLLRMDEEESECVFVLQ